jgi:hypothetical protein
MNALGSSVWTHAARRTAGSCSHLLAPGTPFCKRQADNHVTFPQMFENMKEFIEDGGNASLMLGRLTSMILAGGAMGGPASPA